MDGKQKILGDAGSTLVLNGRQIVIKIGESKMTLNITKMMELGILK
jgi:hypothetical protein